MNRFDGHDGCQVLCLTIIDHSLRENIGYRTRVLLGVRDPRTNHTHPNVLSSPTKRLPSRGISSIDEELGDGVLDFRLGDERGEIFTYTQHAVESLLTNKLGFFGGNSSVMGPEFSGNMQGQNVSVRFGDIETGIPRNSDPTDPRERVTMYNLLCFIEGADFPNNTASYYDIGWRSVEDFVHNRLNGAEVCDGLCIATSKRILAMQGNFEM